MAVRHRVRARAGVEKLEQVGDTYALRLADGSDINARAVVIATV